MTLIEVCIHLLSAILDIVKLADCYFGLMAGKIHEPQTV